MISPGRQQQQHEIKCPKRTSYWTLRRCQLHRTFKNVKGFPFWQNRFPISSSQLDSCPQSLLLNSPHSRATFTYDHMVPLFEKLIHMTFSLWHLGQNWGQQKIYWIATLGAHSRVSSAMHFQLAATRTEIPAVLVELSAASTMAAFSSVVNVRPLILSQSSQISSDLEGT